MVNTKGGTRRLTRTPALVPTGLWLRTHLEGGAADARPRAAAVSGATRSPLSHPPGRLCVGRRSGPGDQGSACGRSPADEVPTMSPVPGAKVMIKGAWDAMVGRTVAGVVGADVPYGRVLYVCFDDGSGFEIYGRWFEGSSQLRYKSVGQAIEEFEGLGVPYQVHTDRVPALDPRDVGGPHYIGVPDPAEVKDLPDGPQPPTVTPLP